MTYVNLSTNVPVQIQAGGTAATPTQLSEEPSYGNWLVGENYSFTAPNSATNPNGTTYFALWYGSQISTNRTVQGDVVGAIELHACYVDSPGAPCQEPGAPGRLHVAVTPANASVTVNGAPFPVDPTSGVSEAWENSGTLTVRATLEGYYPTSFVVVVSPGNLSYANLTLHPIPGYLVGTVSPAIALVTLSPAATVHVTPNGSFAVPLVPGPYIVTASLYGYVSESANVTIVLNQTSWANFTLKSLFGWVNGTIVPSSARLTADGGEVPVAPDGHFSLHIAPGPLWLNGSAPGYLPVSLGPLTLAPLGHLAPLLWLPKATGDVVGTVSPPTASVSVNGTSVPVVDGTFQLTLYPGNYSYRASSPGFSPGSGTILVVHNTTVALSISLAIALGWLASTLTPARATATVDAVRVPVNATGTFNVTLSAGPHTLVVSAVGYRTINETVRIPAGATLHLSVALTRTSSTSTSITLDAGVSAAVVAVIAIAAFVIWTRQRRITKLSKR